MSKVALMVADGLEEIEGLTVADICRRAGLEIDLVSNTDSLDIMSSHQIAFKADKAFHQTDLSEYDCIVLPGGMKGHKNLEANSELQTAIRNFVAEGKYVAAICAAPTILGRMGILKGRTATCYPGMEDALEGATLGTHSVEVDGTVITSRGMGTTIDFALKIVEIFMGAQTAERIGHQIVYLQ